MEETFRRPRKSYSRGQGFYGLIRRTRRECITGGGEIKSSLIGGSLKGKRRRIITTKCGNSYESVLGQLSPSTRALPGSSGITVIKNIMEILGKL